MNLQLEQYKSALKESALKLTQDSRYPVRLKPICRQLVVHGIKRARLAGCKSLLVDARVKPVILLNSSVVGEGSATQSFNSCERFLIAHELGHLVLHQHGARNPSGSSEYWKLEELCDAFARHLLIPEQLIEGASEEEYLPAARHLEASLSLAKKCSVPWSAAAMRLTDARKEIAFFWVAPVLAGGFKILVSSLPKRKGVGKLIKTGTTLCDVLTEEFRSPAIPHPVEARKLNGLAGIQEIKSAAVCPFPRGLRLAVVPA